MSSLTNSRSLVLPLLVIFPKNPLPAFPRRSAAPLEDCLMLFNSAAEAPETWLNEPDWAIGPEGFLSLRLNSAGESAVLLRATEFPVPLMGRSGRTVADRGGSGYSRFAVSSSFMKLVEGRRVTLFIEESSSLIERERDSKCAKRGLFFFDAAPLSVVEPTFLMPSCEFLSSWSLPITKRVSLSI